MLRSFSELKVWGISPLVILDEDWIEQAVRLVVLVEFSPQSGRFNTDDRVNNGVVGGATVEDLEPDQILVELLDPGAYARP